MILDLFGNEIFEVKQWRDTPSGALYNNGLFFCYYEKQDIEKFDLLTD